MPSEFTSGRSNQLEEGEAQDAMRLWQMGVREPKTQTQIEVEMGPTRRASGS